MNAADVTALVGGVTALIVAITGLVAVLRSNANQNAKADVRAAKLDAVHEMVKEIKDATPPSIRP